MLKEEKNPDKYKNPLQPQNKSMLVFVHNSLFFKCYPVTVLDVFVVF